MRFLTLLPAIGLASLVGAQGFPFGWVSTIHGTGIKSSKDVVVDQNGSVITAGYFNYSQDFDPGPADLIIAAPGNYYADVYVQKLNADGTLDWVATFGDDFIQECRGVGVDGLGNIVVCGYFGGTVDFDPGPAVFELTSDVSQDQFLVKLSPDGSFIWAVKLSTGNDDFVNSMVVAEDGRIHLTGVFTGALDCDPGSGSFVLNASGSDAFVITLDPNGSFIWAGRIGSGADESGRSIAVDTNGNVLVTGSYSGTADLDPTSGSHPVPASAGTYSSFVVCLSSAMDFLWGKGLVSGDMSFGQSIIADELGNVFAFGTYYEAMDFDPGPDTVMHVPSMQSLGANYIIKFSPTGEFLWGTSLDSLNHAIRSTHSIAAGANGHLYVTATMGASATLGSFGLAGHGMKDIVLIELDQDGTVVNACAIGGPNDDEPSGVTVDPGNTLHLAGIFRYTVDFDPGPGSAVVSISQSSPDIFTLRLGAVPAAMGEHLPSAIVISPNPAMDRVVVSGITAPCDAYAIIDAQGRIVEQQPWRSGSTIGVAQLPSGAYQVLFSHHGSFVGRAPLLKP